MSVIKLFLARNIIYFCGLNKTLCQPGSFQGFLKTRLLYLFQGRNFPRNSTSPARNFKKKLGLLVPRPEFSVNIPFPSLEVTRNSCQFQARKTADTGIRSTVLLVTKLMSYHYTISTVMKNSLFLIFIKQNDDCYNCMEYYKLLLFNMYILLIG